VPAPIAFVLAVGEPSLGRYAGGRFDLAVPLVIVTILLLTRVLGIRVRWPLVIGAVLAAPPMVALAERISYPMTAALFLAIVGVASVANRHRPGSHPT
jgi:hypothetical protein